ncbi:thymidylate synthase (FAD) [Actinopolyspora erythraea]|uniref:Flavin-dependent thymidylate synthase n=1 Tax=Actinopolyspora erythraea TaxID=414996 RepID=A0A099D820_9ACTN|nr:FAD-dependent thymidylate synthase [Actinopolyspora erythraea]ASU78513.1 thymidylate synthase (FAD) [Actinopolyspora erythraea]KGI82051.1 hypothetical protein IL38_06880 [Actinopolyspora erythraea]
MKIDLISHSVPSMWSITEFMGVDEDATPVDTIPEFGGRACYQSWSKPNPNTRKNEDYLANIIAQGHESVLEHASATFYVQGISRALTHELIRHRHLSFSQISQRFVDGSSSEVVVPPAYRFKEDDSAPTRELKREAQEELYRTFTEVRDSYETLKSIGRELGLSRKENREAARSVIPNASETKIEVTGNMRAWRDVIKRRWHEAADAEIREFAGEILGELRRIAPATFQDIPEVPFS